MRVAGYAACECELLRCELITTVCVVDTVSFRVQGDDDDDNDADDRTAGANAFIVNVCGRVTRCLGIVRPIVIAVTSTRSGERESPVSPVHVDHRWDSIYRNEPQSGRARVSFMCAVKRYTEKNTCDSEWVQHANGLI